MPSQDQDLFCRQILEALERLVSAERLLVGFSGGVDSTALLTALSRQRESLPGPLEAIHFNHGLSAQSHAWQSHCEAYCTQLDIPLITHCLDLSPDSGNVEAVAREARYHYLEQRLEPGSVYLTAHNRNDQAETLLLNMLRGSGVDGMAGIPATRPLGRGWVARPLLGISRSAVESFLQSSQVKWIEDDSNLDIRFDRNFLRHEVIPLLKSRWPAAASRMAATATHLGTAAAALDTLVCAHANLDTLAGSTLPLERLAPADPMAPLVIRSWLRRRKVAPPPQARLVELVAQLRGANSESRCEIRWGNHALRLYANALHLSVPPDLPRCPERAWNDRPELNLGEPLGTICLRGATRTLPEGWSIGPRRAGDSLRAFNAGPSCKLKKLMQEHSIPPWQRDSIPLLYWDSEPVAVGDWLLTPRLQDWLGRQGIEFNWQPNAQELVDTRDACRAMQAARNLG